MRRIYKVLLCLLGIIVIGVCSRCEKMLERTPENDLTESSDSTQQEEQIISEFLEAINAQGCLGFDYWYQDKNTSAHNRYFVYLDYDRRVKITRHAHVPKSGENKVSYRIEILPESFVPQYYATKEERKAFEKSGIYEYFLNLSSDRARYNFLVPKEYRFKDNVGILVPTETPNATPSVSPRPKVVSDDPFIIEYYDVDVGDRLIMGKTEQSGIDSDGIEDIVWVVLRREGDNILVTTKEGILCGQYNNEKASSTWEKSSLRKWLNEDFYKKVFTDKEKKRILTTTVSADKNPQYPTDTGRDTKDRIFILSIEEALELFPDNPRERECEPCWHMEYDNKVLISDVRGAAGYGKCYWWLRTQGNEGDKVAVVTPNGDINYEGFSACYSSELVVRPAMWVSLEP